VRHLVLAGAILVAPTVMAAQQTPPTCSAPEHRQFDFWAGDWTVTDSAGTRTYGTNLVTQEESGCLIHEHWTGTRGGTGQSFNFFERPTGHWAQVWVAATGNVLRLEGGLDGSAMRLEGASRTPAGATILNRIVYTPEPDGRVRQTWLTSQDSGRTWQASFDGWYRRRGT